jgi:hypothetical protein
MIRNYKNYNALSNQHLVQNTTAHPKSSQFVMYLLVVTR